MTGAPRFPIPLTILTGFLGAGIRTTPNRTGFMNFKAEVMPFERKTTDA